MARCTTVLMYNIKRNLSLSTYISAEQTDDEEDIRRNGGGEHPHRPAGPVRRCGAAADGVLSTADGGDRRRSPRGRHTDTLLRPRPRTVARQHVHRPVLGARTSRGGAHE